MINSLWTDGVVLIDPEYVKERKVFGHVLAAFRYGREDLDVLGLTFRKDLYLASEQIFPLPEAVKDKQLTRLQVKTTLHYIYIVFILNPEVQYVYTLILSHWEKRQRKRKKASLYILRICNR
jgi:hypothetical protein